MQNSENTLMMFKIYIQNLEANLNQTFLQMKNHLNAIKGDNDHYFFLTKLKYNHNFVHLSFFIDWTWITGEWCDTWASYSKIYVLLPVFIS